VHGRFIVFEGGEGCGKSTQAELLASRIDGVLTRQPGGTSIGGALRAILLDPSNGELAPRAEALLMAADRAQHADELIQPTLREGRHVVCDRYTYSSVAYQGYGRQLDPDRIRSISGWATEELWPDVVVLLDLAPEIAHARLTGERDRFEQADTDFHRRVRDGFLTQAAADPDRWVVVDAVQSVEAVASLVWAAVTARLDVHPKGADD
jgi:dTMP kinase